jgi:hypothetical protein
MKIVFENEKDAEAFLELCKTIAKAMEKENPTKA